MKRYFTRNKKEFIVRTPHESDADAIIAYSKIMFASTDQTLTTLEEYSITTEGEIAWIRNFAENPNAVSFIAELNHEVVGLLFFVPQTKKKNAHTGEFGVSVHPDHQALGIGRALIEVLLEWATGNQTIEKVFLTVFATNTHAIRLYSDMGFVEEGRFPKAIRQSNGDFVDVIQMYRFVP